ncbi:MAG: RsmB/NOP family class I SAM-dependent RNA methyltransferase [Actinobacteria bacterium]|nr:RsmB/NOP family class I SAM-dependent RNA methyltransferase [Actinomycetota bacterium]
MSPNPRRRRPDPARRVAYDTLRTVHAADGYANLVLSDLLSERRLDARDAAFATELAHGTLRREGTYDRILVRASGRALDTLQPSVVDALRLGAHQLLGMRVPTHAAVGATVDLAAAAVGERVTGVVNAVLRKVAQRDLDAWLDEVSGGVTGLEALALRTHHPAWIARAFDDVLGDETLAALEADNESPRTTLVVRPGLYERSELVAAGAVPTPFSPYGAAWTGNPTDLPAVRDGRAGVQDEGSQLVALALSRVAAPHGPWLDLCAGPGGKSALLAGLAAAAGDRLLASERQPHRARLVRSALRAYPSSACLVVAADGTRPAWRPGTFARVLADVPCTGLGALRRRPEARWRRRESDLDQLVPLQLALLRTAVESAMPGGAVAYVTCSPHRAETEEVVAAVLADGGVEVVDVPSLLPEVPDAARGPYLQLWPQRHGTDAMFCAILRRGAEAGPR